MEKRPMTKRKVVGLVGLVVLAGWMIRPVWAQDTTSLLSAFLVDLRAGRLGVPLGAATSYLYGDAADTLAQRNGTTRQSQRVYDTFTDSSNYERLGINTADGEVQIVTEQAGTGSANELTLGTSGTAQVNLRMGGANRWIVNTDSHLIAGADNNYDIGVTAATRPRAMFLAQPSVTAGSGTGVTVNDSGSVREVVYKVTVTFSNATTNGTTHDLTIATLPAKTFLTHALAELVTPYVCEDTCTTATLSGLLGSSAGGNQYLLSFDADAAAAVVHVRDDACLPDLSFELSLTDRGGGSGG